MAGGLGMVGLHGAIVDGGATLGQTLGVPQVDWMQLAEGELAIYDPATDPCLSAGGHYHGEFCHYGSDVVPSTPSFETPPIGETDEIPMAELPDTNAPPAPEGDVLKLG